MFHVCFFLSYKLNPLPSACYLSMVLSASFISFIFIHFIYYYQRKCFLFLSPPHSILASPMSKHHPTKKIVEENNDDDSKQFASLEEKAISNLMEWNTNLINISFASFISNQNVNFIKGKFSQSFISFGEID